MPPVIITEPVHLQLANACREEIAHGVYRPAERFPSERELSHRYGVSRATANKVISNLIAEDVLVLEPGIGTRVAPTRGLHASLRAMESFTDHARAEGFAPETRVLRFERLGVAAVPAPVREALGLEPQAEVFYFERLRIASGEPVILEHRWVRADLAPKLDRQDLAGSLYHYLETHCGIYHSGERHTIYAKDLSAEEAAKFELSPGAATLVVEGPGFIRETEPIWYQILLYRADRYQFTNEVHVHRNGGSLTFQRRA